MASDNRDDPLMIGFKYDEGEASVLSAEKELMECHWTSKSNPDQMSFSFPGDCLSILRLMKGNQRCVDCQEFDVFDGLSVEPMYASVTHGTLICGECATVHSKRKDLVSID
jgi:hypothetical protein